MQLAYPAKFYLSIVYDLSWDDCNTLEKLETLVTVFPRIIAGSPFFAHKGGDYSREAIISNIAYWKSCPKYLFYFLFVLFSH